MRYKPAGHAHCAYSVIDQVESDVRTRCLRTESLGIKPTTFTSNSYQHFHQNCKQSSSLQMNQNNNRVMSEIITAHADYLLHFLLNYILKSGEFAMRKNNKISTHFSKQDSLQPMKDCFYSRCWQRGLWVVVSHLTCPH